MSAPIRLVVIGFPAPQGSKRVAGRDRNGRAILVESSKNVKPWRESVVWIARRPGAEVLDGPLLVSMVFTFRRPRSHYRTGKNAHLLRDNAPARPSSSPDLSKLLRSTEDALTDAGVWADDSRVVEYGRAAKVYAGEDPDSLEVPGAVIVIRRIA